MWVYHIYIYCEQCCTIYVGLAQACNYDRTVVHTYSAHSYGQPWVHIHVAVSMCSNVRMKPLLVRAGVIVRHSQEKECIHNPCIV